LDEEGLLEDWPQERAIAEGRTAAILSSVDGGGKAKIIRFLTSSKLLTPLKRDSLGSSYSQRQWRRRRPKSMVCV